MTTKIFLMKIISLMTLFALVVATNVVVMVYGWGLYPKNWFVIIFVGILFNGAVKWVADFIYDK